MNGFKDDSRMRKNFVSEEDEQCIMNSFDLKSPSNHGDSNLLYISLEQLQEIRNNLKFPDSDEFNASIQIIYDVEDVNIIDDYNVYDILIDYLNNYQYLIKKGIVDNNITFVTEKIRNICGVLYLALQNDGSVEYLKSRDFIRPLANLLFFRSISIGLLNFSSTSEENLFFIIKETNFTSQLEKELQRFPNGMYVSQGSVLFDVDEIDKLDVDDIIGIYENIFRHIKIVNPTNLEFLYAFNVPLDVMTQLVFQKKLTNDTLKRILLLFNEYSALSEECYRNVINSNLIPFILSNITTKYYDSNDADLLLYVTEFCKRRLSVELIDSLDSNKMKQIFNYIFSEERFDVIIRSNVLRLITMIMNYYLDYDYALENQEIIVELIENSPYEIRFQCLKYIVKAVHKRCKNDDYDQVMQIPHFLTSMFNFHSTHKMMALFTLANANYIRMYCQKTHFTFFDDYLNENPDFIDWAFEQDEEYEIRDQNDAKYNPIIPLLEYFDSLNQQ